MHKEKEDYTLQIYINTQTIAKGNKKGDMLTPALVQYIPDAVTTGVYLYGTCKGCGKKRYGSILVRRERKGGRRKKNASKGKAKV